MDERPSLCLNHPDRRAAARCHRCGRPVCDQCLLLVPDGEFCSAECLAQFRGFHARYVPPPRRSRLLARLAFLLGALVVAAGLLYGGAYFKIEVCQKILRWLGAW